MKKNIGDQVSYTSSANYYIWVQDLEIFSRHGGIGILRVNCHLGQRASFLSRCPSPIAGPKRCSRSSYTFANITLLYLQSWKYATKYIKIPIL